MGLCFSKKQHAKRREEQSSGDAKRSGARNAAGRNTAVAVEAMKTPSPAPAKKEVAKPEEPAANKRTVFVVKAAAAAAAAEVAAVNVVEVKRAALEEEAKPVAVCQAPVRTSSCTKEEVDAILIQCGRLSRSSSASGKAPSGEHGAGHRRYAGSKRSYDFDHERRRGGADDDCDWGREGAAASSRPSPRRRTPERKRSASHDGRTGGGSGSRRVSRSPGRRAEMVPALASSGAARQQPGKMVSVPARDKGRAPSPVKASSGEKGRAPSPVKAASGDKGRAPSPVKAASGKRYPSPRSNSPARGPGNENAGVQPAHGPVLSRSNSRKAEQSPYRRNPMAELDENALANATNHNHSSGNTGKAQKVQIDQNLKISSISHPIPHQVDRKKSRNVFQKSAEATIAVPQKAAERPKDPLPSCGASKQEKTEIVEDAVASDTKPPSSRMNATHSVSIVAGTGRRSSRDFDHSGNSYASLLLEDIQNYHQQNTGAATAAPAFSLPACVSKACSILEAVADLNSSSSENKKFEVDRSVNDKESDTGRYDGGGRAAWQVVESEVVVKDDLMEPSLHKYVSVRDIRGESEPQESAGSNSFAGNAWTCSWEPNSVYSTDRTRSVSQSSIGDEVEQRTQKLSSQEPTRCGSTSNVPVQRGRVAHRGAVNGRTDARGVSASSSVV
jgi:hypothetical protein